MKISIFPGKYHQNGGSSMAMLIYRSVILSFWAPFFVTVSSKNRLELLMMLMVQKSMANHPGLVDQLEHFPSTSQFWGMLPTQIPCLLGSSTIHLDEHIFLVTVDAAQTNRYKQQIIALQRKWQKLRVPMLRPAWKMETNQFEMDGDCETTTWQLKIWLIIQLKQPVSNGWFSSTRYYNPQSNCLIFSPPRNNQGLLVTRFHGEFVELPPRFCMIITSSSVTKMENNKNGNDPHVILVSPKS